MFYSSLREFPFTRSPSRIKHLTLPSVYERTFNSLSVYERTLNSLLVKEIPFPCSSYIPNSRSPRELSTLPRYRENFHLVLEPIENYFFGVLNSTLGQSLAYRLNSLTQSLTFWVHYIIQRNTCFSKRKFIRYSSFICECLCKIVLSI